MFRKLIEEGFTQERRVYNKAVHFGSFVKSEKNYYFNVWFNYDEKKLYIDKFSDDGLPLGIDNGNIRKYYVDSRVGSYKVSINDKYIAVLYQQDLPFITVENDGKVQRTTTIKNLGIIINLYPENKVIKIEKTSNFADLVVNKNGQIMVIYETRNEKNTGYEGLKATLFDRNGNKIKHFILMDKENTHKFRVLSNNNEFIIVWIYRNVIKIMRTDFTGQIIKEFSINLESIEYWYDFDINDEEMLLLWSIYDSEKSDMEAPEGWMARKLFAQKFDLEGNTTVKSFQVNSEELLYNESGSCSLNSIGNFVISWSGSYERYKYKAHSYDRVKLDLYLSLYNKQGIVMDKLETIYQ